LSTAQPPSQPQLEERSLCSIASSLPQHECIGERLWAFK
jgi:hypothetical protein